MYHHWLKQRKAGGSCSEMTGFTRICPSPNSEPDGLEAYIPSIFTRALTPEELAKYGHFGVLNRPYSVVEAFSMPEFHARVVEEYVLICETDHVLTKPMPNLAGPDDDPFAAGHQFGYMHPSSRHDKVVQYCWPGGTYASLSATGPSPLFIRKRQLAAVAHKWLNCSFILRSRPEPATLIQDWVLEMWGYTIAAASVGIKHRLSNLQIEPGAHAPTKPGFEKDVYIFHYTYGIEYQLSGRPQGFHQIGEWSMDKRHYGAAYPPRDYASQPPPNGASASARWLFNAWTEAIEAAGDTWPDSAAMGTVGWRREAATEAEIQASPLASAMVNTHWTWAGIKTLTFLPKGELRTPWGEGKWSLAKAKVRGVPACDAAAGKECLCIDFSGALHHATVDLEQGTFLSVRVGDSENVKGVRISGS